MVVKESEIGRVKDILCKRQILRKAFLLLNFQTTIENEKLGKIISQERKRRSSLMKNIVYSY